MEWWGWIIFGLVLLGAELLVGTFYLLFVGLAALVVALISGLGLVESPALQALLFLFFASVLVLVLRRPLLGRVRIQDDKRDLDSLVGEIAIAQDPLLPGAVGRVEMRGTGWSAKNVGPDLVTPGQRCRVERTDGLMLLVRGEGG